ncbi:MAG: hypothetical protein LUE11_06900 [Clostridia bacterium]|nr:hypothetical protein [Clostridia bacterium]
MNEFMTVREFGHRIGAAPDTVRRGIRQGKLPGVAVVSDADGARFVIPRKAVELFANTGITPMMLAQSVMQAETIEQGIAYLRAVFVGEN